MIISNISKKTLTGALMLACLTSPVSHASDWDELPPDDSMPNYAQGNWGLGVGATGGALAGGPPGLLIGAIVGKLVGRHQGMQTAIDDNEVQLQSLRSQLDARQKIIHSLQQQDEKKQLQLASLGNVAISQRPDFAQLMAQGFTYTVHFKTGSDRIETHLMAQCQALGRMLKSMPGLEVELKGYADERGDEPYNQLLSEKRLQAVKRLLLAEGINENAIHMTAKGEQELLQLGKDPDSLAFDRRVVITITQKDAQS